MIGLMRKIYSFLRRALHFPLAYGLVKSLFLFHFKKIRRAVWLPDFIKVKNSTIIIKTKTTPKSADLHFLGWPGMKDYFSLSILRKLAASSQIIFDVGADIGLVSLYIADANPAARIFSFEPSKHSFPVLLETIKKNNNHSITPLNSAVGAKDSSEVFYYSPTNSVVSSLKPRDGFIPYTIEVTTIESFCVKHDIKKIDLIKIDVEGFEADVIAGLGDISRSRPIIHAEVLNESYGAKIAPVLPADYCYFRIVEEKKVLKEDKKIDRTSRASNNYLFVPREKISLLNGLSLT
jgi:FkbM family methyltransferase